MVAIRKATFQPLLKDTFWINFEDGRRLDLVLDEVEGKEHLDTGSVEHFSLIFSGPDEMRLMQNTFPLNHEKLGLLHVFLVPINAANDRCSYEAVYTVDTEKEAMP